MIVAIEKDGLIIEIIEDTLPNYIGLLLDSEQRNTLYCDPDIKGKKEITFRGRVVRKRAAG